MGFRFLKQSLVAATLITISINFLSRIFGFVRELAIANYFGTSSIFDIFIIAMTIPELIVTISLTALPPALLPSLKKISNEHKVNESNIFWLGLFIFSVLFIFISFLFYEFRENILLWFDPDINADQIVIGKQLITVLSLYIFFQGIAAYFRAWMYEKKHFIIPVSSNIVLNIAILTLMFLLYDKLGIESLVYGWLFGAILVFILNGYFVFIMVKPKIRIEFNLAWVKILVSSVIAVAAVECISLMYPLIDRYLAGQFLGPGQISALRYAGILVLLPIGVLVVSFNVAIFPWVSDFSMHSNSNKLKKLYKESFCLIFFLIGLIAAGFVLFSKEIVYIVFQRGAFNQNSLNLTSSPLMYYAIGLLFYSIYIFQMRFYYAKRAFLRLGIIRFIMLLIKLILSYILVFRIEQNGLALATTIAWISGFILMTFDLGKIIKVPFKDLVYPSLLKTTSLIGVIVIYWMLFDWLWPTSAVMSFVPVLLKIIILGLSGILLYFGLALRLKFPEPRKIVDIISSRFLQIKG